MLGRRRGLLLGALIIALVVALALVGCGSSNETTGSTTGTGKTISEPVSLKYSYTPAQNFTYDLTMVMNGKVSAPGVTPEEGDLPKDTTVKMRVSSKVDEVKDGVATVTYRYEFLEMSQAGEKVDTSSVPADQEITVKIDSQGKVVSVVKGGQSIPGLSSSSIPMDPSQFSSQMNVVFPPSGTAKAGDEWTSTDKYPIPGTGEEVEATTKAKLVSVTEENGRKIATIDYTLDMPLDIVLDLGKMMQEMGLNTSTTVAGSALNFKMSMKGKEAVKGTSRVDTATGMPVSFTGDIVMDMDMQVLEAPAGLPESAKQPIAMDITAKLTMNEVK